MLPFWLYLVVVLLLVSYMNYTGLPGSLDPGQQHHLDSVGQPGSPSPRAWTDEKLPLYVFEAIVIQTAWHVKQ